MDSDTIVRAMLPTILPLDLTHEYWFDEGCFIIEILNSQADPTLSIARARVPAGQGTHWHRLTDITERYVILEGRGMVEIGNLAPQAVGPGDTVVIPPRCRQRIFADTPADLVFLALCTPRFVPAAYVDLAVQTAPEETARIRHCAGFPHKGD